jgi:hypothetical protein
MRGSGRLPTQRCLRTLNVQDMSRLGEKDQKSIRGGTTTLSFDNCEDLRDDQKQPAHAHAILDLPNLGAYPSCADGTFVRTLSAQGALYARPRPEVASETRSHAPEFVVVPARTQAVPHAPRRQSHQCDPANRDSANLCTKSRWVCAPGEGIHARKKLTLRPNH